MPYDLAILRLDQPIRLTSVQPFAVGNDPALNDEVEVVSYAFDRAEAPSLQESCRMIDSVYQMWETEKITLVFIEHDMDIVFKIAPSIRVLCYGRLLAEGTPDEIRTNQAVIDAYLGTGHGEAA